MCNGSRPPSSQEAKPAWFRAQGTPPLLLGMFHPSSSECIGGAEGQRGVGVEGGVDVQREAWGRGRRGGGVEGGLFRSQDV